MDTQCKQKIAYWAIPGLLLQVAGGAILGTWESSPIGGLAVALFGVGTGLFSVGLAFYAKAKGYHLAWGVAGVLSLVGWILLALLQDKSQPRDSEQPVGISFARQAARASWVAPLLACIISSVQSAPGLEEPPMDNKVIAAVSALLIVAGLGFGIVALLGIRKHGRDGILKPAVTGIAVNLFFILLATCLFLGMTSKSRLADERLGRDAFLEYPGWFGTASLPDAIVTITSLDFDTPAAQEFNALFTAKVSILIVGINNFAGKSTLTVEPSSLRLKLTDGTVEPSLATKAVLQTVRKNREEWLKRYSGPLQVPPGRQWSHCIAFIPYEFDMSKVVSISVPINGHDTLVEGRYMTGEQKTQLTQLGLEQLQVMDSPPDTIAETNIVAQKASGILSEQMITKEALGVETLAGVFEPIIEAGCRVPCSKTEIFSTTADNQEEVSIHLFRGNGRLTKDNILIGCFQVYGIPPTLRGIPQIAITFTISIDGDIILKISDEMTGKLLKIKRI